MQKDYRHATISLSGHSYKAILADTPSKRAIGLMFRRSIGSSECMLFIFPRERRYGIWMHNMLFPIDILWLDSDMRVVDMKENAKRCALFDCVTYTPKRAAKYVLEFNAGTIEKARIKLGTKAATRFSQKWKKEK
ncbi:MAG: DUF192 domain-containing protein [Candidatus Micrarchaeia archaeon]